MSDAILTHIVPLVVTSEAEAEAIMLEARVFGREVTAWCGYTWAPSRDPDKYPVCPECLRALDADVARRANNKAASHDRP